MSGKVGACYESVITFEAAISCDPRQNSFERLICSSLEIWIEEVKEAEA